MKRKLQNLLVTGGAGFIGSNFIRYLLRNEEFSGRIVNLDALTYAGNLGNLKDIENTHRDRYFFVQGNICDAEVVASVFAEHDIDTVVHFAAESHVDRSIVGPAAFMHTNILGTFTLLEEARRSWQTKNPDGSAALREDVLFHHVSTDEVFGSLGSEGKFSETTPYDPHSPYSASKAASDHLARAWNHTYQLPLTVSNCSNNYGPYQFPEKLIPLMILNMRDGKALPVYGNGSNVRDWLHVDDHSSAIWAILRLAPSGETYNVGGKSEKSNLELLHLLIEVVSAQTAIPVEILQKLITFVKDRPGHDQRYAIDSEKIERQLGWRPARTLRLGLEETVAWYLTQQDWVDSIRSGAYKEWVRTNYESR
jgi:dTDP-glucose 4,6-dehydratase